MNLTIGEAEQIINEYCNYRNYSEDYCKHLCETLKRLGWYLYGRNIFDLKAVVKTDYYQYMSYLKKLSELKRNSEKTYSSYLKKIFSILTEEEKILINPFSSIAVVKSPVVIRDKVLSESEMKKLIEEASGKSLKEKRDKVVIELLYCTGIRIRELINLELSDFLTEEKLLFIRNGKGKKDRVIPLSNHIYPVLTEYVNNTRRKLLKRKKRKQLFFCYNFETLNRQSISNMLGKTAKKAGIEKKVSSHIIRHSFATHLLERGADIREIQLLLGHTSIKSTQVYLNLSNKHLKKLYSSYHPLENELYFDVESREDKIIKGGLEAGIKLIKEK